MFGKKNKKIHYLFKTTIVNVDNMDEPWYNACTRCNKNVVLKNQRVKCPKCCNTNANYCPR